MGMVLSVESLPLANVIAPKHQLAGVLLDRKELRDHKDHKDRKELRDHRDHRDHKDHRVHRDYKDHKGLQEGQ